MTALNSESSVTTGELLVKQPTVTAGELLVKQPNNVVNGISHDKLKTIDNLVSIMNDLKDNKKKSPHAYYELGALVNLSLCATASVSAFAVGVMQGNIVFGPVSLGILCLGIYSASSSKINRFDSSTTIWNVVPRLLCRKDFKRKKKEFLELRESHSKIQEECAKAREVTTEKINNLLEEVNNELSLGTSYLSYDSNKNRLELRNQHEYKSETLRQAVLMSETSQEKFINMLTK